MQQTGDPTFPRRVQFSSEKNAVLFCVALFFTAAATGAAVWVVGSSRAGLFDSVDRENAGALVAEIIRSRVAWPAGVEMRRPATVQIEEDGQAVGFVELQPGARITALAIDDAGMVECSWTGYRLRVPLEDTSLVWAVYRPQ